PYLCHHPPHVRFLLGSGDPGMGGERPVLYLNLHARVAPEIEVPVGMLRSAPFGGDHQVGVAVGPVDEGGGIWLTAAAARGGEQQDGGAVPFVALHTTGLLVTPDMFLAEEHGR